MMRRFARAARGALCRARRAAPPRATRSRSSRTSTSCSSAGRASPTRALDDIEALGADSVRSLVLWRAVAPRGGKRAAGLQGRRPARPTRRRRGIRYDDLVRGAQARGLGLSSPRRRRSRPGRRAASSGENGDLQAGPEGLPGVRDARSGARYSGAYADENQGGGVLPRVTRWSLLERAEPAGLADAAVRAQARARWCATAAVVYRALARAGDRRAAGERARPRPDAARRDGADRAHERARCARRADPAGRVPAQAVLPRRRAASACAAPTARGTAAGGSSASRSPASPTTPTSAAARGRRPSRPQAAGEITISVAVAAAPGARPGGAGAAGSRAGCRSTTPSSASRPTRPTASSACALALQPAYINQSDWMAYRDRRVRAVAQYKLVDEAPLSSFQSGLRFLDGRAKPAYDAYQLPIWVSGRGVAAARLRPGAPGRERHAADRADPAAAAAGRRVRDGQDRHGALAARAVPHARAAARRRLAAGVGRAGLARGEVAPR